MITLLPRHGIVRYPIIPVRTVMSAASGHADDFLYHLVGGPGPAIMSVHGIDGALMMGTRLPCAAVHDLGDQESAVGGVADRRLYALVGHHAVDNQIADIQVAQNILDVGRVEDAGRRLRNDDFVPHRPDLLNDPRAPRPLGMMQARDLVVEA